MRGNLVWQGGIIDSRIIFVPSADGEYEVVDGGRITQRQDDGWYQNELERFRKIFNSPQAKQSQPEDNPEYVITAFRRKDDSVLFYHNDIFGFPHTYSEKGKTEAWTLEHHLKYLDEQYEIYSVKRTIDSQEFKVEEITEQGKIDKFELWGDSMMAICDFLDGKTSGVGMRLKELTKKKDKQTLITTASGEEIYEGDSVYLLSTGNWTLHHEPLKAKKNMFTGIDNHFQYFSTKEKAEEHLRDNKPVFSVNDIIANSKEQNRGHARGFYELDIAQFMHLAKEKMKS